MRPRKIMVSSVMGKPERRHQGKKKQVSREFSVGDVTTHSDHTRRGRISRPMSDNLSHVKTICQQVSKQNLKTRNNIKHVWFDSRGKTRKKVWTRFYGHRTANDGDHGNAGTTPSRLPWFESNFREYVRDFEMLWNVVKYQKGPRAGE